MEALEAAIQEETMHADDLVEVLRCSDTQNEWALRQALIRIAKLEAEAERVKNMRDAIVASYQGRLDGLWRQVSTMRTSVQAYIERLNDGEAISFPDVGTAYLTTRKAKVEVVERDKFEVWAEQAGLTKTVVDLTAAKREALIFAEEDGELAPGVEYVPEGKTLALRKPA